MGRGETTILRKESYKQSLLINLKQPEVHNQKYKCYEYLVILNLWTLINNNE